MRQSPASGPATGVSFWMAATFSPRKACVPRRIRAVMSCSPASARLDGSLSGPPNDFGWRGSFRAAGACGSQIGPDALRRGAASAGLTDTNDSSAMLPASVNARRGDEVNRM